MTSPTSMRPHGIYELKFSEAKSAVKYFMLILVYYGEFPTFTPPQVKRWTGR